MTASKVYLISGSNRGIGFSFVKQLSLRPNSIVIATAREPEKATELNEWIKKHPNVHVFKYDASVPEDAYELAKQVGKVTDGVDVLIANAAISDAFHKVIDAPDYKWLLHHKTNVLGPVFLYKAFYELLKKHETRQVIFISSVFGSITNFVNFSATAYGMSKASINYLTKELSFETKPEGFTVISLHPGIVSSDMGQVGRGNLLNIHPEADVFFQEYFITPDQSAQKQIEVIDKLTPEDTGKFYSYEGHETPF